MSDIWAIVGDIANDVHGTRCSAIADAIGSIPDVMHFSKAKGAFGPRAQKSRINRLRDAWLESPDITSGELAAAFRAASCAANARREEGSIEPVWSGPSTPLVPTRRTEQVMLELINSASRDLFVVSLIFYRATSIAEALSSAVDRGVKVRILLHGGLVSGVDSIEAMKRAVPGATLYRWCSQSDSSGSVEASVHAKCVVCDCKSAFVTSANLTSRAMERNIELGVLIRGGDLPRKLEDHLRALVNTDVLQLVVEN